MADTISKPREEAEDTIKAVQDEDEADFLKVVPGEDEAGKVSCWDISNCLNFLT